MVQYNKFLIHFSKFTQSGPVREAVKFSCLWSSLLRFCQKNLALNGCLWYSPFWQLTESVSVCSVSPPCQAAGHPLQEHWAARQELPVRGWHNFCNLRFALTEETESCSSWLWELWPLPPPPNAAQHRSAKSRHPSSLFFSRSKETLISFFPSEGECSSFACKQQLLAG